MRICFIIIYLLTCSTYASSQQPSVIVPVGHIAAVTGIVFSPDGKLVVSNGGEENNIKIWETQTGKLIKSIDAHSDLITSVSFSNDGKYLLTTGHDQHAKVWDMQQGNLFYDVEFQGSNWIQNGAFSKDGKSFLIASDIVIEHHDLQNKKLIKRIFDSAIIKNRQAYFRLKFYSCQFSPDGKKAVTTSADSCIRLWNIDAGKVSHTINEKGLSISAGFNSAGNRFLYKNAADSSVKVWSCEPVKQLFR